MEISSSEGGQIPGKTKYQLLLIAGLNKEIEAARRLDPENIAAEIEKTGFSCRQCGKCCKRAFGDNRVIVLPSEIEKIREHTGLSKLEIAGPLIPDLFGPEWDEEKSAAARDIPGPEVAARAAGTSDAADTAEAAGPVEAIGSVEGAGPEEAIGSVEGAGPAEAAGDASRDAFQLLELLEEDIDAFGNIHAFGWMLRRKMDGDCVFLEPGTNRCRIYAARPMLCRTYPFYMEELKLYTCECEGLGYPISREESLKLAGDLLSRYLAELEDMLGVYEKFENFEKDGDGPELARKYAKKGAFTFIVHDSSGVSKIHGKIQEYD